MFPALSLRVPRIKKMTTFLAARTVFSPLLPCSNFSQAKIDCGENTSERRIISLIGAHRRNFRVIEGELVANYKNKHFDTNGEVLSLFLIELLHDKGSVQAIDSICRLLHQPIKVDLTQFAINAIIQKAIEEKALGVEKLLNTMWKADLPFVLDYDAIITNILLPFLRWESIDKIATKHTFRFDTYVDIFDTLLSPNSGQKDATQPYKKLSRLLHRWKTIGVNVHQKNILEALEAIILHLADDLPDRNFLKFLGNL